MSNTLIVRDATLAINGVSASALQPEVHIRERIEEAGRLDSATVFDCAEVLRASAGASGGDPDVLEALMVIAIAHPEMAKSMDLSAQVLGRRLAARLERTGDAERALAVLRLLLELFPRNEALEREMAALMRRQGMVQDLAERYEARADELLAAGKTQEAIAWYREILLLDRTRADIARRIRELRQAKENAKARRKVRGRLVVLSLLLSAGSVGLVKREMDVRQAFDGLPLMRGDSLQGMEERLLALEQFIQSNPVWHGAFDVLEERNQLRYSIKRLKQRLELEAANQLDIPSVSVNVQADIARMKAISEAHKGDRESLQRALALFSEAMELADEGWSQRAQTERDIESIREHLQEDLRP